MTRLGNSISDTPSRSAGRKNRHKLFTTTVLDGLMNAEKISDESGERYGILSLAKDPNRDGGRNTLLDSKRKAGKICPRIPLVRDDVSSRRRRSNCAAMIPVFRFLNNG